MFFQGPQIYEFRVCAEHRTCLISKTALSTHVLALDSQSPSKKVLFRPVHRHSLQNTSAPPATFSGTTQGYPRGESLDFAANRTESPFNELLTNI